jgi:hypothetical protein
MHCNLCPDISNDILRISDYNFPPPTIYHYDDLEDENYTAGYMCKRLIQFCVTESEGKGSFGKHKYT